MPKLRGEDGGDRLSKPRYDWWGYVKSMIRRYPQLCEEYAGLKQTSITASYDDVRHGSGVGNPTERAAIRELPENKQREHRAVQIAIDVTGRYKTGKERLKLIDLVFWRRSHTLSGAAYACFVSYRTAARWHGEFIRLVAYYYGLLDS